MNACLDAAEPACCDSSLFQDKGDFDPSCSTDARPVTDPDDDDAIPRSARILGFSGLLPFIGLTLLMHLSPEPELKGFIGRSLISYAAVILSFLGGSRWGLALRAMDGARQTLHLVLAVLPPLCAWILLTARLDTAIASFAVLFAALGLLDAISMNALLAPPWYGRLRNILSVLVVLTLVGAMFAL